MQLLRLVFVCVSGLSAGLLGAAETSDDYAQIQQLMASTTEAFNAHDAVRFAQLYTEDADLVTVRGERMRGRAEIEKGLEPSFAVERRKRSCAR